MAACTLKLSTFLAPLLLVALSGPARAATDVEALLARMTLREKIGQMTMLSLNAVSRGELPFSPAEPHALDPRRMRRAIVDYGVGTVFNIGHHAFDREHWRAIVSDLQALAARGTRLKIPLLYGIDALHGMNYATGATLFPHQIGLAATWNPDRVREAARVTAYEARAAAIPWVFAPTAEPGRNVVHARFYESFGEDPLLCAALTAAMVEGLDAADPAERVGAALKHFIGYSIPASGRDRAGAEVAPHVLRESFLPPYAAGIRAGAGTVILNLADLNGVPVHGDRSLVTGWLKEELGFAGPVVSDWMAVDYLHSHHHVAEDSRQAIAMAVNAGVDLVMVPFDLAFCDHLEALVREGRVPAARIDDAVRRVLSFKQDLGLFEQALFPAERHPLFGSAEFRAVARRAAAESLTLLKNTDRLLPLARDARVLVTGPAADSMAALNGGWSYTWQGVETDARAPGETIVKALRGKIGAGNVVFRPTRPDDPAAAEAAVRDAAGVDAVVACLGEAPYAEVFGNLDDLTLPRPQIELVQRLARSGKPVVLVLVQGRPRIIGEIEPVAGAVVLAYLPGNEGGRAIADLLFGDAEPAGRLPFTYPVGPNALSTYDHRRSEAYAFKALYPFGWGLAYTTFRYAHLTLEPRRLPPDGALRVAVEVKNTGERPGAEVVQLYTSDRVASLGPPVKRLRGFQKIHLAPGEVRKVTFTLTPRDLAFVGADHRRVAEAGDFTVTVGDLTRPFVLTGSREIPAGDP